jgi:hypothetical protein
MVSEKEKTPTFNSLTNLYSVSKTLRFELRPQYSTIDHINEDQIVDKGEDLKNHYKTFKKILDQVFSRIINDSLDKTYLDQKYISTYQDLAFKHRDQLTDKDRAELKTLKETLKKQIDKSLDHKDKKAIFSDPVNFLLDNESEFADLIGDNRPSIEAFNRQKGYLSGYLQNRTNIFDHTTNETSVAFRIVEENLAIFLNNRITLQHFLEKVADKDGLLKSLQETLFQLGFKLKLEDLLSLDYFNRTLSQSGIDQYNLLISGKTLEDGAKLQGINEILNQYLQQHQEEKLHKIKLKQLYKQILSESKTESFTLDFVEDNKGLAAMLLQFIDFANQLIEEKMPLLGMIQKLKNSSASSEFLSQLHLNRKNIKRLSNFIYKDYGYIEQALEENFLSTIEGKITKKVLEEHRKQDTFTIHEILVALQKQQYEKNGKLEPADQFLLPGIVDFVYQNLDCEYSALLEKVRSEKQPLFDLFKERQLLEGQNTESHASKYSDRPFNDHEIKTIKTTLDFYKHLQSNLAIFQISDENLKLDSEFYSEFDEFYQGLKNIIPVYNKSRNFLTKKPFSTEKTKLIFNSPQLLDGWSKSKESDCLGTIFIKDGKYYIGIINSATNAKKTLFEPHNFANIDQSQYFEKMNLFFLSDLKRDFPKKYFSEKWHSQYPIPADLREKYDYYRIDEHKDDRKNDLEYHHQLIAYYQDCLKKDTEWQIYQFKYKSPEKYSDVNEFLSELTPSTYKMEFTKIPAEYIKKLVDDGKLYFFQIYSKDFSEFAKGKPNLHTLYLKAVFDQRNAEEFNYNYKISGSAEIFYRPASIEARVTHPKNQPIKNKNKNNLKTESVFQYDLCKDRRYMSDKFFLHLPVELNRTPLLPNDSSVNSMVNQVVSSRNQNYFLGIDRGERHLIYLVLIDQNGKIIKQQTLNQITSSYQEKSNNQTVEVVTDYHDLLNDKEKLRKKNLQEWQSVENIKELKAGYLSNVVNEIGKIVIEYQPVIMLENLNTGFKNSRIKIEKQVYQKFEKALIDKFNYFMRKDIDPSTIGGLYHALQLTKEYSKQYNGKQNGIIYYIPASYTSNIDPTTGFISAFIQTRYENVEKAKALIEKFNDITYDADEPLFCFTVDYKKFSPEAKLWQQNVWQIYTNGDRIYTFRDKEEWQSKSYILVDEFKDLFAKYQINYHNDLKTQILSQTDAGFFKQLLFLLRLTLQMRNSHTTDSNEADIDTKKRENDYIISPVKNQYGKFYDSRQDYMDWPENADANGAYNIARKGLIMLKHLKEGLPEKRICDISTEEWVQFVEELNK